MRDLLASRGPERPRSRSPREQGVQGRGEVGRVVARRRRRCVGRGSVARFLYSTRTSARRRSTGTARGADRGDAACMHAIGLSYRYPMRSEGVAKDMTKAVEWTGKSVRVGARRARHAPSAGLYEHRRRRGRKDEAKAIELYVKAAGMGHPASASSSRGLLLPRGVRRGGGHKRGAEVVPPRGASSAIPATRNSRA